MPRHAVLLSGGIDSSTLLAEIVSKVGLENASREVVVLFLHYGQKHAKEHESARAVADYYGVPILEEDISFVFRNSTSALLAHAGKDSGEGTYAEQLKESKSGLVDTYVPYRNGLFISYAASYALSIGAEYIYYGAHADDRAAYAYPDCSREFVKAQAAAIEAGTGGKLKLEVPFLALNKRGILLLGHKLGVPYHLTWSCYEGREKACGKCATCRDRLIAFKSIGRKDPIPYESE